MNRSYSKIRHIQESNLRLEKRLLSEQDDSFFEKINVGEINTFIPIKISDSGDIDITATNDNDTLKVKVLNFNNKVLEIQNGTTNEIYDEKNDNRGIRYFSSRSNPKIGLVDSKFGMTTKQKEFANKLVSKMLRGSDKETSLKLNKSNFDNVVLKSDKPVLVDFTASWCGPCQELSIILDEIEIEYKDKIIVGKVDVDVSSEIAKQYKIKTLPVVLFFNKGVMVKRIDSLNPKETYLNTIKSIK